MVDGRDEALMNEGIADCGNARETTYRRGCRCDACRSIHLFTQKKRQMRALDGALMVDATEARNRLKELFEIGMTQREVCNYGVSLPTVHMIATGKRKRIRRDTHDKIMAIEGRRPNRNQRVSPKDSIELVRKWHDRGLSYDMISKLTGVSKSTLRELYLGDKEWLFARTAVRLRMHSREVFDALVCLVKERSRNGKDN